MVVPNRTCYYTNIYMDAIQLISFSAGANGNTINSGVQVQVLLFGDCAFSWHRLCGVLIIMEYFSTRLNIW